MASPAAAGTAGAHPIEHFIFLIHPCCYEETADNAAALAANAGLFIEQEQSARRLWEAAIDARPARTFLVLLTGPQYHSLRGRPPASTPPAGHGELRRRAVAALGGSHVYFPVLPFDPEAQSLADYFSSLTAGLRAHLAAGGLDYDASTATAELWGESFEGCVPGYGGMFAEGLALVRPPRLRFDYCVSDSRFIHAARQMRVVPLAGTDVECWLFECHDGTSAAVFQPRLTAAWLDKRVLSLRLHTGKHQICNKQGHTVFPPLPVTKGVPPRDEAVSLTLEDFATTGRWIRCFGTDFAEFGALMAAATLRPASQPNQYKL
eukprot:SAG22_NODE_668_length_7998_cov_4.353462_2_plen_320_part_00